MGQELPALGNGGGGGERGDEALYDSWLGGDGAEASEGERGFPPFLVHI